MDILQHHIKNRFLNEFDERSQGLLNEINRHFTERLPNNFNADRIERVAPSLTDDYLRMFTKAVVLDWPKAHCIWLLSHAAEMGEMHLHMLNNIGEFTPVTLAGRELFLTPKLHYADARASAMWRQACLVNAILGPHVVIKELCRYTQQLQSTKVMRQQSNAFRDVIFNVHEQYILNQIGPELQVEALTRAFAFSEPGKIEALSDIEIEQIMQFRMIPVVSMLASCWQRQQDSISKTAAYAIEARLEYCRDIAPEPGDPRGDDSIELYGADAMLMTDLIGFLALHYQRTGELPEFESPYLPRWLIRGDFPSREDVLFKNPPEFTREALGIK